MQISNKSKVKSNMKKKSLKQLCKSYELEDGKFFDFLYEQVENGNPSSFIESFNEMHKKDQGEFLLLCADRTDDRFNLSWNHEVARKCLKFVIKDKYGVSL